MKVSKFSMLQVRVRPESRHYDAWGRNGGYVSDILTTRDVERASDARCGAFRVARRGSPGYA